MAKFLISLFLVETVYVYANRHKLKDYQNILYGLFLLYLKSFFEVALWVYHFFSEGSSTPQQPRQLTIKEFEWLIKTIVYPTMKNEIQSIKNFTYEVREWQPSMREKEIIFQRRIAPSEEESFRQELSFNREHILAILNDNFLQHFQLNMMPKTTATQLKLLNNNLILILKME